MRLVRSCPGQRERDWRPGERSSHSKEGRTVVTRAILLVVGSQGRRDNPCSTNNFPFTPVIIYDFISPRKRNHLMGCDLPSLFSSLFPSGLVSQTTEEKIPWEGEFILRSVPWAGLIASCGSFISYGLYFYYSRRNAFINPRNASLKDEQDCLRNQAQHILSFSMAWFLMSDFFVDHRFGAAFLLILYSFGPQ